MKRKKITSTRSYNISPINPSMHFVLFLILALILVVIVGYIMQQTAITTRARIMCPQSETDPKDLISELSKRCTNGVEYVNDLNGCGVWTCRLPQTLPSPRNSKMPKPSAR